MRYEKLLRNFNTKGLLPALKLSKLIFYYRLNPLFIHPNVTTNFTNLSNLKQISAQLFWHHKSENYQLHRIYVAVA